MTEPVTKGTNLNTKCAKKPLAAGVHPNPLGELTTLIRPRSCFLEEVGPQQVGNLKGNGETVGGKLERNGKEGAWLRLVTVTMARYYSD